MSAAGNGDRGFGDAEVLRKELDESGIGFAVVRLGAEVDGKFAGSGFDNLFLRGAGLDGDNIFHTYII